MRPVALARVRPFAGFAFGWIHLQFSPEVIVYRSVDDEHPEDVVQVGTQIRLAL